MRGVQFTTAVGMLAELGELTRFEYPRQLMAWLGVTPSEHSSGNKQCQGSITKTGNSYARTLQIEAAWGCRRPAPGTRHPARVTRDIQCRHEGIPKAIIDRAWDAQLQQCRSYRKLSLRRKNLDIAIVGRERRWIGCPQRARQIFRLT
jgi:transposase